MKISAKKIVSVALVIAATSSFAGVISDANNKIKAIPLQITKLQAELEKAKVDVVNAGPKLEEAKANLATITATYNAEAIKYKAAKTAFNSAYEKDIKAKIDPKTDQGVIDLYNRLSVSNFQLTEISKAYSATQSQVRYYQ